MAKKYLFNAITTPFKETRWFSGMCGRRFENNPGDMVYAYAVMNTLATSSEIEFETTGYYNYMPYSPAKIDEINQTCEAFVIPLADIFSSTWTTFLSRLTDLVEQLKIPCVVPCVGLRDDFDPLHPVALPMDETVKRFVRAILDRSAIMGVRGKTTADYLKSLGFVEDRDFCVLGCPTLYTYGEKLPEIRMPKTADIRRMAFHLNFRAADAQSKAIFDYSSRFPHPYFISQFMPDFQKVVLNQNDLFSKYTEDKPEYVRVLNDKRTQDGFKFFLNYAPWVEFLKTLDFQIGHRIHGTLLGLLSGVPSVIVPFETRTRELAEYHGVPMLEAKDISDSVVESLDFSSMYKRQKENFRRYLDFYAKNRLETSFGGGVKNLGWHGLSHRDDEMMAFANASIIEQMKRKMLMKVYNSLETRPRVRAKLFGCK